MRDKKIVSKCLDALKNLKEEQILDERINNDIKLSINKVESIMNDNNLKIAVLGEFSSGKSTFINALLKNKLLSYADEPTTAINTYITYGEKEKATIYYRDGVSKSVNLNNIEKYTKEGKVGKEVDKVKIEYNNSFLKKGVTIIDTPGANIDNERHNIQRDRAINECSIGIFLISAKSLTSKSFIKFLQSQEDKLGKFIFVISKCDMLEEDIIDIDVISNKNKLEDILSYVKDSIKSNSKLKNPKIYPISAYKFLNNEKSTILDVRNSFLNLEKAIDDTYKNDKEMLVLLEMLKTLKQICPEIRDILNDKNKLCEYEIKKVNGEIESFERFVYKDFENFQKSIDVDLSNAIKDLDSKLHSSKDDEMTFLRQRIKNISGMRQLKNSINGICSNGIDNFLIQSNETISIRMKLVGSKQFKEVELNFQEYFLNLKRTYKKLNIERNIKIKKVIGSIFISLVSLFVSKLMLEILFMILNRRYNTLYWSIIPYIMAFIMYMVNINSKKKELKYHIAYIPSSCGTGISRHSVSRDLSSEITTTHGLGAGAVIGVLAGGPVGALIGAGIGAVLTCLGSRDRVEEIKKEVIDALEAEMDNIVVKINANIIDISKTKRNNLIDEYKNYVGKNISLYKTLLEGIYKYNNNKFTGLNSSNNKLKKYLKEFEDINNEIDDTIKSIKATS